MFYQGSSKFLMNYEKKNSSGLKFVSFFDLTIEHGA